MALSAPAPRKSDEDLTLAYYPMAAVVAYQGGLAVLDSTGYVKPGVSATSLTAVGIFDFTADVMEGTLDNSGGSPGDLNARVRQGVFCFANKSADLVVEADVGQFCYIYDDETVCHTGTGKSVAGIVKRVDSDGVWVHIGAAFGSALASEISSRQAISTALALTTTPGGGSLVGVYDPDGKLTATDLNAGVLESVDGRRVAECATGNTLGCPVVAHVITVPSGASGTVTTTLDATYGKLMITGIRFIKTGSTGGASDTVKLTDGTHDISSTLALSGVAAGTIADTTSISATYGTVAAGGTLVANYTNTTTSCQGVMIVTGLRVA